MKIIAITTGTYLDYRGEFVMNNEVIGTWSYDKKQDKYITKFVHKSYNKGFKFLYANSPEGLRIQIGKRISTC